VAISNDDTGISEDPEVRFAVAKKIVERAADFGIPAHDIVVDPLVMPIGAMATAGQQVFTLVRRLREELGVNTTCGASNISFGLPNRHGINNAFLPMAFEAGMTSAIMNPVALPVGPKEDRREEGAGRGRGRDPAARHGRRNLREAFRHGVHQAAPRQGDGGDPRRQLPDEPRRWRGAWIRFNQDPDAAAGRRAGGRRRRRAG
jgi:5-methyltetrahydrofolate--homocysteine methyltransferase